MSFQIQGYQPNLSFRNAPSVNVSVLIREEGEPEKVVNLVAADADARRICRMAKNPDWNGHGTKGVDDQIATGEVDFAELSAFVDREILRVKNEGTFPASIADRLELAGKVEARVKKALAEERRLTESVLKLQASNASLTTAISSKSEELSTHAALVEVKRAEVAMLDETRETRLREIVALAPPVSEDRAIDRPEVPVRFGLAARVKRPNDPVNVGIVVRVEHKSEEGGYLHHVEWISGPAGSGTYWFPDLVAAESLPEPEAPKPPPPPAVPQDRHPLNALVRASNARPNDKSYGRVMGHSFSPRGWLHHVTWISGNVTEGTYLYEDLTDLNAPKALSPELSAVSPEPEVTFSEEEAISVHDRVTVPGLGDEDDDRAIVPSDLTAIEDEEEDLG